MRKHLTGLLLFTAIVAAAAFLYHAIDGYTRPIPAIDPVPIPAQPVRDVRARVIRGVFDERSGIVTVDVEFYRSGRDLITGSGVLSLELFDLATKERRIITSSRVIIDSIQAPLGRARVEFYVPGDSLPSRSENLYAIDDIGGRSASFSDGRGEAARLIPIVRVHR